MSNLTIKTRCTSLLVMLVVCSVLFVGVSTATAQGEFTQVADVVAPDDQEVSTSLEGGTETVAEGEDTAPEEDDGFNMPPTFPADWTPDDIIAYMNDITNNSDKRLFLADDGQPRFIGVAANNGFSRGHEGLITEDEIQNGKAKLISAPKFTVKVRSKNIRYALTEEKSCEQAKYKRKAPKVGDLRKDGIYYICVKADQDNRTWEILSPLKVVRNTIVKGYALVASESTDCREVPKKKWQETPQAPTTKKPFLCTREKQMLGHENGTVGIGGARHELWKSNSLIQIWQERQQVDYVWPVPTN